MRETEFECPKCGSLVDFKKKPLGCSNPSCIVTTAKLRKAFTDKIKADAQKRMNLEIKEAERIAKKVFLEAKKIEDENFPQITVRVPLQIKLLLDAEYEKRRREWLDALKDIPKTKSGREERRRITAQMRIQKYRMVGDALKEYFKKKGLL